MFFCFCFALLFIASCNGYPEPPIEHSQICTSRNGYYKEDGSCDSYIECRDFHASRLICPEGLNYNPAAKWPAYPCGYPMDVSCLNRGISQPAKPTAECPHQYGFFPSLNEAPGRCGQYRMCMAGIAFELACPVGLAFNPAIGRCDWPDLVPSCDVDDFLGFRCPAPPLDLDGKSFDIVQNFKYEGDCFYFFSCEAGRARLLSCDYGFAFDPVSGHCVDVDFTDCNL